MRFYNREKEERLQWKLGNKFIMGVMYFNVAQQSINPNPTEFQLAKI